MDESLMLDTLPEVEAETPTEDTPAEAEAVVTEEGAEEATEAPEADGRADAEADMSVTGETEAEEAAPPVVRVKYNKQEREFSVDEAAPLVEMGLKYESFKPDYEKLKDLATGYGMGVSEMIDHLSKQSDDALYQKILDDCEGNERWAKREFESQKAERDSKIKAAREAEQARLQQEDKESEEALHKRMADEFIELQREEPELFKTFKDVPKSVLTDAVKNGRSLLDSYLRYQRAENKKSEAVKAKQAQAAKASTGSMSGEAETINREAADFAAAFRSMF